MKKLKNLLVKKVSKFLELVGKWMDHENLFISVPSKLLIIVIFILLYIFIYCPSYIINYKKVKTFVSNEYLKYGLYIPIKLKFSIFEYKWIDDNNNLLSTVEIDIGQKNYLKNQDYIINYPREYD